MATATPGVGESSRCETFIDASPEPPAKADKLAPETRRVTASRINNVLCMWCAFFDKLFLSGLIAYLPYALAALTTVVLRTGLQWLGT